MLTVVMATRNRARILRDVLESYCRLEQPSSGWKLIVVNNGSTDHTAQVLASFANRLPLHPMREPRLGKNNALNTGLELLEGDLAVFTDDDTFPRADWLVQLRNAADFHLDHSVFGGAIVPRWEVPPPSWIQWVDSGPVYTLTDPSWKEGPIPPYLIFGPNMAVRASVFQSGLRLDTSIGPRGSNYAMGSETELTLRLSRRGYQSWYVPGAVVEHLICKAQMKKSWVLGRAYRFGRGYYRNFCADQTPVWKLWMGIPRRLFRDIPKEGILIGGACLSFNPEAVFRCCWRFNFLRGQATEARILARERRTVAGKRHALS